MTASNCFPHICHISGVRRRGFLRVGKNPLLHLVECFSERVSSQCVRTKGADHSLAWRAGGRMICTTETFWIVHLTLPVRLTLVHIRHRPRLSSTRREDVSIWLIVAVLQIQRSTAAVSDFVQTREMLRRSHLSRGSGVRDDVSDGHLGEYARESLRGRSLSCADSEPFSIMSMNCRWR